MNLPAFIAVPLVGLTLIAGAYGYTTFTAEPAEATTTSTETFDTVQTKIDLGSDAYVNAALALSGDAAAGNAEAVDLEGAKLTKVGVDLAPFLGQIEDAFALSLANIPAPVQEQADRVIATLTPEVQAQLATMTPAERVTFLYETVNN